MSESNNVYQKLLKVQKSLQVSKERKNEYKGKVQFTYRSCEDIYEAVKPLLLENNASLIVTDEIVEIGGYNYIKAIATFINIDNGETISTNAFAKEKLIKEKEVMNTYTNKIELKLNTTMGEEQLTGSASSYARKYALCGLFLLDDNKDPDSIEKDAEQQPKQQKQPPKITDVEIADLMMVAKKASVDIKVIIDAYSVNNLSELTQAQYNQTIKRLKSRGE